MGMTKKPDEIKKGLECCKRAFVYNCGDKCDTCDLFIPAYIKVERCADALAYIQQLETDNQQLEGLLHHMNQLRDAAAGRALKMEECVHQLEAERDAAVADLREADIIECEHCKHYREYDSECGCECQTCAIDCACVDCYKNSHWEWRGVQKEE